MPETKGIPYAKAIIAALAAGLSYLIPVSDNGLNLREVLAALLAAAIAAGVTYGVPAKELVYTRPTRRGQHGYGDPLYLLVVVVIVIVILVVVLLRIL